MPSLAEFDYAMLRPGRHVPAIRKLGGGTVIARGEGQPFRIVGNDAVVYKLDNPGFGAIALRCFLDDDLPTHTAETYRALSQAATQRRLLESAGSPLVQRLAWFQDGITLQSSDLRSFSAPVLATEWIEGPTLFRAADHAARSRNSDALISLASGWQRAVETTQQLQFAHGALSPDNALVDLHRGIVLIDYDFSWWPGIPPKPAPSQGLSHYRHRHGSQGTPWEADAFAALVIYVSLRVLADSPALRERYGQPAVVRDGKLLFDQRDLDNPKRSELFRELDMVASVETRSLATILREAAIHDPAQVPSIADAAATAIAARRVIIQRHQPAAPPPATEEPLASPTPPPVSHDAPPRSESNNSTPVMRAALDRAIATGDAVTVTRLWPILSSDPESSWQAIPANALVHRFIQAGIDEAMRDGSPEKIIEAVSVGRSLGVPTTQEAVRAARRARLALKLQEQVAVAVESDDRELLSELNTIESVLPLTEHDTQLRSTMSLASELRTLLTAIEADDDEQILRSVAGELWSTSGYLDQATMERVQLARGRMRWKEEIRRALKARDGLRLTALLEIEPSGGSDKLTATERKRVQRLVDQTAAVEKLSVALGSGSDRQLVDAMNEVESTGARLPDDLDWANVSSMIDRLSLVTSIRRAALSQPRDYPRLGRLLPALREAYGSQTPYLGGGLDLDRLEWEVQREAHRRRLLDAIATGNETAIAHAASPDPYGVVAELPEAQRSAVEALLQRLQQANPLSSAGS
ncbi:MAG: hypothetical protein KF883_11980 [Thermomicrobiales bacterium]|nr:hypothetical protein [Thermomicrobiales bacterium]